MKNDGEQLRDDARQEEPQPDPVFEGRVSPLWAGISLLVVVCLAAAVLYAVLRDPNVPHVSRAPAPGSVPLPDNPVSTTTGQGVPFPGDRASGTPIGPDIKTAPPPLAPARPAQ